MDGIADFQNHIDVGLFCWHVIKMTLVIDFDDIGFFFADQRTDGCQRTRHIGNFNTNADKTSLTGHAAHQHLCKKAGIDIAAADNQANFLALEFFGMVKQGRKRRRTGTFDHAFFNLNQHLDGPFDTAFINQYDVVELFLADFKRQATGLFDRNAFGNGDTTAGIFFAANALIHAGI